jgi:hypothetical protein
MPYSKQISQLRESIDAAVTFLLEARTSQGWWLDFDLAPGPSDEWVTAYVGTMLATVPDSRLSEAVSHAWELLQSRCQRPTGAWGYNYFTPGDADSIGWALQLAEAVGASNSERAQQAKAALATHQRPNGGMATYATDEPIRAFIAASPHQTFEGWCGSQTCVSAAIAALPEYRFLLHDYLKATQTSEGNWQCYWWSDHEYVTALAAEALAACGQVAEQFCIEQAVAWGVKRLSPQGFVATQDHPDGSPFATAWCLRLLLLDKADTEVQAAIAAATHWLLGQQHLKGAWISSARLRVPYPNDRNPNQFTQWIYHGKIQGSLVFDQHSTFTTATVINSLQKAAEMFLIAAYR